jgi:hypothetical protein
MTYEEGIQWLLARGGSITSTSVAAGAEVVASAHDLSACVIAEKPSDRSDVRRCELEAIARLKRILEA